MVRMNRDKLLGILIAFFPNAHAGETRNIVGRMHSTLIFQQRDEGRVPGVGSKARSVVERNSGVVAELWPEEPVRPVLMKDGEVVPNSAEVHLRISHAG